MTKSYKRFVFNFFTISYREEKCNIGEETKRLQLCPFGTEQRKWKSKRIKLKFIFYFIWCVLVSLRYFSSLVVIFEQPVNSDGNEELLNGGETRNKLSLVFSLFPPSVDIVRRDTLYERVHNDFGTVDWSRRRGRYN